MKLSSKNPFKIHRKPIMFPKRYSCKWKHKELTDWSGNDRFNIKRVSWVFAAKGNFGPKIFMDVWGFLLLNLLASSNGCRSRIGVIFKNVCVKEQRRYCYIKFTTIKVFLVFICLSLIELQKKTRRKLLRFIERRVVYSGVT